MSISNVAIMAPVRWKLGICNGDVMRVAKAAMILPDNHRSWMTAVSTEGGRAFLLAIMRSGYATACGLTDRAQAPEDCFCLIDYEVMSIGRLQARPLPTTPSASPVRPHPRHTRQWLALPRRWSADAPTPRTRSSSDIAGTILGRRLDGPVRETPRRLCVYSGSCARPVPGAGRSGY